MRCELGIVKRILIALVIFLSGMTVSLYAAEFIVVENATAKAGIRLGDKTPGTIFAAKELQKYVKAMSGVELKILATNEVSACTILISNERAGRKRAAVARGLRI